MTERQALELKDVFYRIKQFYFGVSEKPLSAANLTSGEASEHVAVLKEAEDTLFLPEQGRALPPDGDRMLRRACIYIREALVDKNIRLAGNLSAFSIRLLGVYLFPYMSRRRFYEKCLLPLREEHGDGLFAEEEADFLSAPSLPLRLRPCFRRTREGYYYEDDADASLKEARPFLHTVFLLLGLLLFVGSIVAYGACAPLIAGGSSVWFLLGYLGAAAFGVGLYSVVLAFVRQYMGQVLTLVLTLGGAVFMVLSVLLTL